MKIGKWFWKKGHETDGEIMITNDVSKVLYTTDEWYQYYRKCANNLKKIVAILDDLPNLPNDYTKGLWFWDELGEIRSFADIKDPEEMKEWLLHCRTIRRGVEIKKPKKVENDIGRYKRECIDKLKHLKVSRSLLVEDRTYQTVDWWIREMENNMIEFQTKKFHIEELSHNMHRIRRKQ